MKKENKRRFNWLDAVIILFIMAIVVGGWFYMNRQQEAAGAIETKTIEFAIELREVPLSVAQEYEGFIGETVVIGVTNVDEGVVTDISWKNSEKITKDIVDGQWYISDMPDNYDEIITIQFEGVETPDKISSGHEDISVGFEMPFHGKGFAGQGYIVGLRTEVPK